MVCVPKLNMWFNRNLSVGMAGCPAGQRYWFFYKLTAKQLKQRKCGVGDCNSRLVVVS
jgi:hypothetical protein